MVGAPDIVDLPKLCPPAPSSHTCTSFLKQLMFCSPSVSCPVLCDLRQKGTRPPWLQLAQRTTEVSRTCDQRPRKGCTFSLGTCAPPCGRGCLLVRVRVYIGTSS